MVTGRCLFCDEPASPGSAVCEQHARRWSPDHAGRPPDRIRAMRRRIAVLSITGQLERLPLWVCRGRERYGLPS